jgi:tetratricopeptide (TPR) repeat protein
VIWRSVAAVVLWTATARAQAYVGCYMNGQRVDECYCRGTCGGGGGSSSGSYGSSAGSRAPRWKDMRPAPNPEYERQKQEYEQAKKTYARQQEQFALEKKGAGAYDDGALAFKRGKWDKAIKAFTAALDLYVKAFDGADHPRLVEARAGLVAAIHGKAAELFRRGAWKEALDLMNLALRADPNNGALARNQARMIAELEDVGARRIAAGQFAQGRLAFETALPFANDKGHVLVTLGDALRTALQRDEAIATYRRALPLLTNEAALATTHSQIGLLLEAQGLRAQAFASLKEGTTIAPPAVAKTTNANLGQFLASAGLHREAAEALERARELDPSDRDLAAKVRAEAVRAAATAETVSKAVAGLPRPTGAAVSAFAQAEYVFKDPNGFDRGAGGSAAAPVFVPSIPPPEQLPPALTRAPDIAPLMKQREALTATFQASSAARAKAEEEWRQAPPEKKPALAVALSESRQQESKLEYDLHDNQRQINEKVPEARKHIVSDTVSVDDAPPGGK